VGVSAVDSNKSLVSIISDRGTEGGKDTGVDKWI
jgi:hypothetical protein